MDDLDVVVAEENFAADQLIASMTKARLDTGAVATFIGYVREGDTPEKLDAMVLEHYPAMTAKALQNIAKQASQRWGLLAVRIYHRVGTLKPGEQIVFVGVASRHRHAAFQACEFIMDFLKTEAPFWKKEIRNGQGAWVDARDSDHSARERWLREP